MSSEASAFCVPDFGSVVPRARLSRFVQCSGCGILVLEAPGGFGKSVLAAQIARSTEYARRTWISCSRLAASDLGVMSCLRSWATSPCADPESTDAPIDVSELITLIPPGPLCVVLDDVQWRLGEELSLLAESLKSARKGSLLIVTSRLAQPRLASTGVSLVLTSDELLFSDDDADALLSSYAVDRNADTRGLVSLSGGQAALVAVLAQHMALGGSPGLGSVPRGLGQVIAECLAQLDEPRREALWVAAQLGEGSLEDVSCLVSRPSALAMQDVARALPLVRVSGQGSWSRFSVHDMVHAQLDCLAIPEPRCAALRVRVLEHLADQGSWVRVAHLVLGDGDQEELLEWIPRFGTELARRCEVRLLGSALERVGPADFVRDPILLLLRSRVQWAAGDTAGALSSAAIAADLAGAAEDPELGVDAALLVSRIHLGAGSYSQAREALNDLVCVVDAATIPSEAPQVHAQLLIADCLLADRGQFHEEQATVSRLLRTVPGGSEAKARLLSALGIGAVFYGGDLAEAARWFQLASECEDAWVGTRLDGRANYALSLLSMGRLEQARLAAGSTAGRTDGLGFTSLRETCEAILASIKWALDADYASWSSTALAEPADALREGDRLSAALDALWNAEIARAARQLDDALAIVENGLRAASDMDAPLVRWALQLEQAAAMAGLGDVELARRTATTIGARVRAAGIGQQRMKAALLEAECHVRMGESAEATKALVEMAPYVRSESANWQTAMYVRACPGVLGPVAAAVGVERLPSHLLRLIPESCAEEALAVPCDTLSRSDADRLARRMLGRQGPRRIEASASASVEPAVCTVRLFGGFEVRTGEGLVSDKAWGKRKARLLFAMLVSRSGKDIPRDQLIDYLWPEMPENRALNNFYVVWSSMKRALAPGTGRDQPCPYVEHVRGVCRVVPGRLHTDLDEFERLLVVARKAHSANDPEMELGVLTELADLYRGELLPGDAYDDWFAPLRERCRHDFEDAMLRAAGILEAQGNPRDGLAHLRRAMLYDPWREDLYQAALRLQIAAGQRSAAIETYMSCRSRLVEDLGIDPSAETRRLYDHVLSMEEGPAGEWPRSIDDR